MQKLELSPDYELCSDLDTAVQCLFTIKKCGVVTNKGFGNASSKNGLWFRLEVSGVPLIRCLGHRRFMYECRNIEGLRFIIPKGLKFVDPPPVEVDIITKFQAMKWKSIKCPVTPDDLVVGEHNWLVVLRLCHFDPAARPVGRYDELAADIAAMDVSIDDYSDPGTSYCYNENRAELADKLEKVLKKVIDDWCEYSKLRVDEEYNGKFFYPLYRGPIGWMNGVEFNKGLKSALFDHTNVASLIRDSHMHFINRDKPSKWNQEDPDWMD